MGDGLTAGQRLGKFQLDHRLGAGGMGSVWAARDLDLDRDVAIKVLHSDVASDSDARLRLARQARALARVRHPNVVTVYDIATIEDRDVLVMELVAGPTFASWVRVARRDGAAIVERMVAAGRGLAAAHAAGLVHRDFKPDNVLVEVNGRVVVIDAYLTAAGMVVGTPGYMAPEQIAGAAMDERADQFAFCVTLWEALTGQRPFGTARGNLAQLVAAGPPATAAIPPALRALLQRGLALDPQHRWPSMAALVDAIEQATRTAVPHAAAAPPPVAMVPPAARATFVTPRSVLVPILIAFGVGTGVVCGGWVILQRHGALAPRVPAAPPAMPDRPDVHETNVFVPPAVLPPQPHGYPSQLGNLPRVNPYDYPRGVPPAREPDPPVTPPEPCGGGHCGLWIDAAPYTVTSGWLQPELHPTAVTVEAWLKSVRRVEIMYPHAITLALDHGNVSAAVDRRDLAGSVAADGGWHHIAMSWDGAIARLYADGEEISNRPCTEKCATPSLMWGVGFGGTGYIDEVQVWSVARTADQIRGDGKRQPAADEPGLYSYFSFDGGAALAPVDVTGHNPPLSARAGVTGSFFRTRDAAPE